MAVVHQGGQSRPLHTSPYWIPDESDPEVVSSDEAVEAVEAPTSDQVTSVIDLTQLGYYSRLSQATAEVQQLVPRSKLFNQVRVSPYNPLLRPRPSSAASYHHQLHLLSLHQFLQRSVRKVSRWTIQFGFSFHKCLVVDIN